MKGKQVIKAVFFDLDETLILRSGAIRAFIKDQYRRYAAKLGGLSEETYTTRFLEIEKNGVIGKHIVYPEVVAALGITGVSADELLADYRANYPNFASPSPGAVETVKAVRALGIKVGIVTNGNVEVQNGKIDALGIRALLDDIVISEGVGLKKPDPAIFALAARNMGVAAAEGLFVGDNPEVDIVGAANAGMPSVWFRNGAVWPEGLSPRASLDVDRLDEILPLLKP